jgi:hypothetical protein
MRGLIGFFTGMILLICFSSCQKEIDWKLTNKTQTDSTAISRLFILDTTLTSGQDTLFKLDLFYDGQKRKSGEDFTEIDNTTGTRYITYYRYSYNNSDTLPYRLSAKYNNSTDSDFSYFSYNGNFIVKDSTVRYIAGVVSSIQIKYFSSLGGNRFMQRWIDFDLILGTSSLVDSTIYTRTVSNNNLISGLDSSWISFSPSVLNFVNSSRFSYDNKTNPFAKLTIWYLGYFDNLDDLVPTDIGMNNLLNARYDGLYPSSYTNINTFSYTYNNAGYPIIARSSGTDGNKTFYFYTHL